MVKSAVQSVSPSGALVTIMPRARAAALSIWSVPALGWAMTFTEAGRRAISAALNGFLLGISATISCSMQAAIISSAVIS